MILLARLFVNPDFANWSGEGGQLHWDRQMGRPFIVV